MTRHFSVLSVFVFASFTLISCVTNFTPAPTGPDDTLVVAKLNIKQTLPPGAFLYDGEKITYPNVTISAEHDATGTSAELVSTDGMLISASALTPGSWRLTGLSYRVSMKAMGSATTMDGDFLLDSDRTYTWFSTIYTHQITGANHLTVVPGKVINLGTIGFVAGPAILPLPGMDDRKDILNRRKSAPKNVKSDGESARLSLKGNHPDVKNSFAEDYPKSEWLAFDWVNRSIGSD